MADLTWLQAQVPRDKWAKLNERRLALKLKWSDILLPATEDYLAGIEGGTIVIAPPAPKVEATGTGGGENTVGGASQAAETDPAVIITVAPAPSEMKAKGKKKNKKERRAEVAGGLGTEEAPGAAAEKLAALEQR